MFPIKEIVPLRSQIAQSCQNYQKNVKLFPHTKFSCKIIPAAEVHFLQTFIKKFPLSYNHY